MMTTFLTSAADVGAFAAVRAEFFNAPFPASSVVVVKELLDARWKLEIEAIAVQ